MMNIVVKVLCAFLRDCLHKHVRDRWICPLRRGRRRTRSLRSLIQAVDADPRLHCAFFDLYSLSFVPAIPQRTLHLPRCL